MRAEGFTRWDAFLRFNSPPRKQVNPLMTQEQEQQLSQTMLAMMQSGGDAPKSTVEVPVYAWRLIRWEADVPLTEEQRQEALAIVPEAMALCGVSAACFAADGDVMTVLLALTRFPARAHRDPVLWLCAHALMEQASVALEQDGTMFIGEEFDLAGEVGGTLEAHAGNQRLVDACLAAGRRGGASAPEGIADMHQAAAVRGVGRVCIARAAGGSEPVGDVLCVRAAGD